MVGVVSAAVDGTVVMGGVIVLYFLILHILDHLLPLLNEQLDLLLSLLFVVFIPHLDHLVWHLASLLPYLSLRHVK